MTLLIIGCHAETLAPSTPAKVAEDTTGSIMSATIDGTSWTARFTHVTVTLDLILLSGMTDTVSGATAIVLGAPPVVGPHVVPASPFYGAQLTMGIPALFWDARPGDNGSVVIDTLTAHRVTGTFEFMAVLRGSVAGPMHQITSGRFALSY
jgi:hypothetical protein